MRQNTVILLLSILFSLLVAELVLRMRDPGLYTYTERATGAGYHSPFEPFMDSRFLEYPPGARVVDSRTEFSYTYTAGSLGIFDREPGPHGGRRRILCIGDSFTHGIGAPQDSSWPRALEQHLQDMGFDVEVWNAGLQGSDPVYAAAFVEEVLLDRLRPDVVLMAVNSTDPFEVALRGGRERFRADGSVKWGDAPWWEPFYARVHLVRLLVHALGYNGYLLSGSSMPSLLADAEKTIADVVSELSRTMEGRGGRLWVVSHPQRPELGLIERDATSVVAERNDVPGVIDMNTLFTEDGRMTSRPDPYFWPIDGHHTSQGYWLFGELLAIHLAQDSCFLGLIIPF